MKRIEWIAQCASHYAKHGHMADDVAQEMAEGFAELQAQQHGADVSKWAPPAEAAAQDIAGWAED